MCCRGAWRGCKGGNMITLLVGFRFLFLGSEYVRSVLMFLMMERKMVMMRRGEIGNLEVRRR